MALKYTRMGMEGWVGQVDAVRVYLSDADGEMHKVQAAVAAAVIDSLPFLQKAASAYLDIFVDRLKACGSAAEPWWLDEVDFRGRAEEARVCYSLLFRLNGDDGGLWTVDMRVFEREHRPFRFERLQG